MSLPEFPTISPSLTREEAINQILSSIAMEELGLSHIINAEGEKLQYVLGTLEGMSGPAATIGDVLKVNESVRAVLQSAAENQSLLRNKLQSALSAAVLTGPTGPAGEDGKAATIKVEPADRVPYGREPYVVNEGSEYHADLRFGIPDGRPGAQGEPGATGAQGATGPTGPTGGTAAIIPFSIGKYGVELSTDARGEPLMIAFSGFAPSYNSSEYLQEGEWATGTITIREDMYCSTAFVMPHDGSLKKLYVLFSSEDRSLFEEGSAILPFVCLAVSNGDELVYTILQETVTFTAPYAGGVEHPMHTIRRGASVNLDVEIAEGTLVAIVAGMMGKDVTEEQYARFAVSGGLYLG